MLTRSEIDDERERCAIDLAKVLERCAWVVAVNDADYVMRSDKLYDRVYATLLTPVRISMSRKDKRKRGVRMRRGLGEWKI